MPVELPDAAAVGDETLRLELRRHIPAPRDHVYRLWTTPAYLERFICPGNTGAKVSADPRVGGRFHIDMFGAKGEVWPHEGEYLEVDPPHRLRFTWVSQASPASVGSVVTVQLDEADGGTLVTLVQERFADEKQRAGHDQGWSAILEQLEVIPHQAI